MSDDDEAERRFRVMGDTVPVMIWMSGADKRCDWFNAGWLRFTGRTMAEELGEGWAEGVHPADLSRCLQVYTTAFVARQPFAMEYRLRRCDGEYRWVLDQGTPRYDATGRFEGYIGSCIDVHEQRERASELEALLGDRDALLKEIHHRVKNNFQLVMSMIMLRARKARTPEEKELARELSERIGALATIHEQLMAEPHASRIDFGEYLTRLIGHLQSLNSGAALSIVENVDSIFVAVDRAVPLGFIVSEVLSHAFRLALAGRKGTIEVDLGKDSRGMAALTLRDAGSGMLDLDQLEASGGRQLIDALVVQAGAAIDVAASPAPVISVRLPAERPL
jgi:PAS domain S-box-containing protein